MAADIPVLAEISIYLFNSIARNTEWLRCCSSCFDSLNHESLVATQNICAPFFISLLGMSEKTDSKQINGPIVPKLAFIVGVFSSPCKLSEKAFNSFNLGKVLNIIFEKGINSPKGTKCPFLYMPETFPSGLKQYKALYFLKSENVKAPTSKLDLFFIAISLYKLYTSSFLFKYIGTAVSGHITN